MEKKIKYSLSKAIKGGGTVGESQAVTGIVCLESILEDSLLAFSRAVNLECREKQRPSIIHSVCRSWKNITSFSEVKLSLEFLEDLHLGSITSRVRKFFGQTASDGFKSIKYCFSWIFLLMLNIFSKTRYFLQLQSLTVPGVLL